MNKQYLAGTALAGLLASGGVAAAATPSSTSSMAPAAKAAPAAAAPAAAAPAAGPSALSKRHGPSPGTYPVRHPDLDLSASPHRLRYPGWVVLVVQLSRNGRDHPIPGVSISLYQVGGGLVGSAVTDRGGFAVFTTFVRNTTSFYAIGGSAGSGVVTVTVEHP